jgi:hypothetical protein
MRIDHAVRTVPKHEHLRYTPAVMPVNAMLALSGDALNPAFAQAGAARGTCINRKQR